jgi:hypothetical protein
MQVKCFFRNSAISGLLMALFSFPLLLSAGCGEDSNLTFENTPSIETIPSTQAGLVFFAAGGEQVTEKVRVMNTGDAELVLHAITLVYEPQSPQEIEAGPAFTLGLDLPSLPYVVSWDGAPGEEDTKVDFSLVYRHYEDGQERVARLVIESNDPEEPKLSIDIRVQPGAPQLVVQPDQVVFNQVAKGETGLQALSILNTGNAPLKVQSLLLLGHKGFHLDVENTTYDVNTVIELDPPMEISPASSVQLDIQFVPLGQEPAEGSLVIQTNDRNFPSGLEVPIFANLNLPCLVLEEPQDGMLNFQGKLVGDQGQREVLLRNCGGMEVQITGIGLTDESSTTSVSTSPWMNADRPRSAFPCRKRHLRRSRCLLASAPPRASP